jgi:hypothetical protein
VIGGDGGRFGRRAPVVVEGGAGVLLAPRGKVGLSECAKFDAAAGAGWHAPPAAGRVEKYEQSFLGCDELHVCVDEVLSVGGASCLGVPKRSFGLGELVPGGVSFDHVTLALGCHVPDLLEGDGEFLGDLCMVRSELLRGGDGVLPDGAGDVVLPTMLSGSGKALVLKRDDLGAGLDVPGVPLFELLAERPTEARWLLGKSSIGFLGSAEVGGEIVIDGPLVLEGVLEVDNLGDEGDAPFVNCLRPSTQSAADVGVGSARIIKGYYFDLTRRGGHAVLVPAKSRAWTRLRPAYLLARERADL